MNPMILLETNVWVKLVKALGPGESHRCLRISPELWGTYECTPLDWTPLSEHWSPTIEAAAVSALEASPASVPANVPEKMPEIVELTNVTPE